MGMQCEWTIQVAPGKFFNIQAGYSYNLRNFLNFKSFLFEKTTSQTFSGNSITLQFTNFDIVNSDNCERDYLEVRAENSTGKILGLYCGNTVPTAISHNGSLWMLFESKSVNDEDASTGKGFMADYTLSR